MLLGALLSAALLSSSPRHGEVFNRGYLRKLPSRQPWGGAANCLSSKTCFKGSSIAGYNLVVQGRRMSSPLALTGLSLVAASCSEALPSLAGISVSLPPFLAAWAGGSVLLSSMGMAFSSAMCVLLKRKETAGVFALGGRL